MALARSRWHGVLGKFLGPDFDEIGVVHDFVRAESPGIMVDVGAHHGQSLLPFADDGWRVYAFEPDPANRKVLERRLRGRTNVVVDDRAVAMRDGELATLFTSPVSTGISSLIPFHPSHRPTAEVETVRLDTYLVAVDAVTVIKTDAEGYDLPILQTFPWHRMKPRAVVCEFEDRRSAQHGYTHRDMADFLVSNGYKVFVSEWYPIVEYGRRHRWRSIRPYPTQLADATGWGNLIAVASSHAGDLPQHFRRNVAWPRRLGSSSVGG